MHRLPGARGSRGTQTERRRIGAVGSRLTSSPASMPAVTVGGRVTISGCDCAVLSLFHSSDSKFERAYSTVRRFGEAHALRTLS
jgi:hypothetical protein